MALTPAQLDAIYQRVLFRPVDPAGIATFANRTDISDAQVRLQIIQSNEANANVSPVVRLFDAALNRVPDAAGLSFFVNSNRGNSGAIATQILNSQEFSGIATANGFAGTNGASASSAAFVQYLFNGILGRTATAGEVSNFTAAGRTASSVLNEIANSNEAVNRNAAGVVTFLDSVAVGTPNTGQLENQTGPGGTNVGTTFVLTTGADNIVGTAGNDTINALVDATAANSTLTAADTINGGPGTADLLNITTTVAGNALNGALVSNVEGIQIRNTAAGAATLDASTVPGLTFINANLGTGPVTVTNAANNTAFGIVGNSSIVNGALNAGYVGTATSARLTIANGTTGAGAVTFTGGALETLAITSLGSANAVGAITTTDALKSVTIDAQTALTTGGIAVGTLAAGGQTLTISGAATNQAATTTTAATGAVVLGALDADFVTVNASGLTAGGISATLGSLTATVTGGAGNDIITTNGVLTTGSVNAGAGTGDRLIVANTADLATTALGAKYTGFEQLQANDGVTANLDNISGITSVLLNDAGGTTVLDNLTAAQASSITVLASAGASTINVKGATTVGQIDTVGLVFNDGDTTLNEAATDSTFTLNGIENLNVTAVDKATITQSAATSGSLTSVTLTGAGDISFTTGNIATANFTLNASGSTGANTLDASAFATNGISITGGTGVDTITGSGQNDIINGGGGNDIINGGAGADALTGGAGNDQFIFASRAATRGAAFAATDTTTANIDRITDFVGNGAAAGDSIQLSGTANVFGTALDFSAATTANVTAVTVATAADFTALAAAVQAASAGVASTDAVARIYDVTVTAGNLAGRYAIVNDDTAAVAATDTIISLTGITGALNAQDFTFTA